METNTPRDLYNADTIQSVLSKVVSLLWSLLLISMVVHNCAAECYKGIRLSTLSSEILYSPGASGIKKPVHFTE